jgi:hypothetical protein
MRDANTAGPAAIRAFVTHMLCWSWAMHFSAAASSKNNHGSRTPRKAPHAPKGGVFSQAPRQFARPINGLTRSVSSNRGLFINHRTRKVWECLVSHFSGRTRHA